MYKQEDEAQKPFSAARLKKLREHGLVLWSTFDWDKASETAKVWMRKDFVEKMKTDSEWHCCLMITDLWFMQSACQPVGKVIAGGTRWVDDDEGESRRHIRGSTPTSAPVGGNRESLDE